MTRRHQSDGHHARGPRVVAGGLAVVVATFAITAVGSAATTTLYVDGGNAGCSNTGQGTSAQPFCTIGAAASKVTAGQTVEVAAGTYPERVAVSSSGTSSAPIVFTAAPGATVTVSGQANGFAITGRSWVTVNGFKVTGTGSYGISVSSSSQITLSNNDVSFSGQRVLGQSRAGIRLAGVTDSVVRDNVSHDNSDHGILLSNVLTNGSTRVTVDGNRTFNNARGYERAAAGIRLSSSAGNTVSGNISYGNEDSGIESYLGSNDTLLYNNVTYANGDHGIDNNQSTGQRMIANSVYQNETAGINVEGASTGATIANNVSVDNAINNTLRQKSNIRVDSASISGTTMDYDLVQLTTAGTTLIWNSTGYSSLASFRSATGQESRGIEGDPKWKSPGTGDFHLTSGSPAIDSANSGVTGQPSADVEGNGRVDDPATANTGVGPRTYDDRGAYEYGTAVGSPPDTSPPDTSITSGPSGTTSASSASFGFSSTEAGSTFECRLDSGAWAACSAPKSLTGLSDGSHTLAVRAIDPAGNTDPSEATRTWTVDTTAPDTSISEGPSGTTSDPTPSFTFSSDAGSTFECKIDSGAWISCSAPFTTPPLTDGGHTFSVRATDAAGNTDQTPAARSFTVNTASPPAPALAPVPKTGPAPPTVDQIGAALHGNLAESAKALRRLGIARLLRRRGFTAQGLDALLAGKFSATLTGAPRGAGVARKIVLATGARSVPSAGRYSLKLKLTRQGMRLLRSDQTAKITVTIKFRDASGRITTARERLRLRR